MQTMSLAGWWEHSHYSQPGKLSPTEARALNYRRWLWFCNFCGAAAFPSLSLYLKQLRLSMLILWSQTWSENILNPPWFARRAVLHTFMEGSHTLQSISDHKSLVTLVIWPKNKLFKKYFSYLDHTGSFTRMCKCTGGCAWESFSWCAWSKFHFSQNSWVSVGFTETQWEIQMHSTKPQNICSL